jgi:hypothetical protein
VQWSVIWGTYFLVAAEIKSPQTNSNAHDALDQLQQMAPEVSPRRAYSKPKRVAKYIGEGDPKSTLKGGVVTVLEGISTAAQHTSSRIEKVSEKLNEFNIKLEDSANVRKLNIKSFEILAAECNTVKFCFDHARKLTEQDMRINGNPALKAMMDKISADRGRDVKVKTRSQTPDALSQVIPPASHNDINVSKRAEAEYHIMLADHKKFLSDVASALLRENEVLPHFEKKLRDFGCDALLVRFQTI